MLLAEVTGRLWTERQVGGLESRRLVTVQPAGGEQTLVAVDLIDVAAGNVVIVATDEAAQAAAGGDAAGVDAAVVALVAGADALDAQLAGRLAA
jgi:ethanolamine utilization protein EutN